MVLDPTKCLPVLSSCGKAELAPGGAEDLSPRTKLQLSGSEDDGWVYTDLEAGSRNASRD